MFTSIGQKKEKERKKIDENNCPGDWRHSHRSIIQHLSECFPGSTLYRSIDISRLTVCPSPEI